VFVARRRRALGVLLGCFWGADVGRPLGEATDPIALAAHRVAQLARGVAHAL